MKTARCVHMKIAVVVSLLLVVVISDGWAVRPYTPVQPDPVLESWRWRSFPELRGLGLQGMAEDKEGRMWFGVDDGVRVYDGVTWLSYTAEDGVMGAPVGVL